VNDGPLSNDVVLVELSGARLVVEAGDCGSNIGGAAIVEPMLVQSPFDCGAAGAANMLRSTGVTGVDEPQLVVGGGAGVLLVVVGHDGGGARFVLRVAVFAGGAAGCTAKGLFDGCAG
jgi:hypothetical protein